MALEQTKKRLDAIKKHYPEDALLIAACERLFTLYEKEDDLKKAVKVSNGAWCNFLKGHSRQGVRLALIHCAARAVIFGDLLPNECKKE